MEREEARKLQYQSGRARSFSRGSITAAPPQPQAPATPKPSEGVMVASDGGGGGGGGSSSIHGGGGYLNGVQEEHHHGNDTSAFPAGSPGFGYLTNTAADMSPLMPDIDLTLDTHAMNPLDFDFVSTPSDCAVDRASSDSTDSASHLDWSQFPIFSPELPVTTPVALLPPLPVPPIPPGGSLAKEAVPAAAFSDFITGQGLVLAEADQAAGQRHGQGMAEGEKGIDLMMRYLADLCSGGNSKGRRISEMGWLLLLLTRSPTFCYTTLSLTSYQRYLTRSADSASRAESFTDYQNYRSQALKYLSQILPSTKTSLVGGQISKSSHSALCERLVCSVQLAHLEATSGNIQDCQNHIDAAARLLLEHETALITEAHRLTDMERKALAFFTTRLVWNDILLNSTRRTIPKAEKVYRRLLLTDAANNRGHGTAITSNTTPLLAAGSSFWDLTGCEGAVLLAMLDASVLGAWRLGEEVAGSLSIRALVGRADKIEAAVEGEIERLSRLLPPTESNSSSSSSDSAPAKSKQTVPDDFDTVIHSLIFAHAILTDLHQIVSGPRASVPEIGDSISRAISSAWSLRQEEPGQHHQGGGGGGAGLKRILAWPFCVAASLAKGDQRDVFREIIARSENGDGSTSGGDVQQLKSIIEQCWASSSSNCRDWKDVVQRSNQFGVFLI